MSLFDSKKKEKFVKIRRASKGRGFLTPAYSWIGRLVLILSASVYLKFAEGVKKVRIINEERIIAAMKKFHSKEHRLIFVFRHAAEEDPPVLMYAFNKTLRRKIQRCGGSSHLRLLYGRDVPNWAGSAAAWLFPKIGAVPVQNRGGNKPALNLLRKEVREGRFPIALAPEEQVVYHMYRTFSIAPGITSLIRWGLESGKPVTVIPLAFGYKYAEDPKNFILSMLKRWELQTGCSLNIQNPTALHPLLTKAAEYTISMLENFYNTAEPGELRRSDPDGIDERITRLCDLILTEAEKTAGLPPGGSELDRLFYIRYTGLDAVYPEHIDPAAEPALPRGLLDFSALKAEVSLRHSQIADVLEYVRLSYIEPPFSAGRGCEFILNLLDLINRTAGGDIGSRYSPSGQTAVMLAGEPLTFSPGTDTPQVRRGEAERIRNEIKTAMQTASEELEQKWEKFRLE